MQLWRKGSLKEVSVVVAEISDEKNTVRAARNVRPAERPANRLGLVLSEPSADQRRELKISSGLLIEDVRSSNSRVDLRPGDIILALISRGENIELKSVDQFNRLLAQFDKSANVTLLVRRGEQQTFVTIKGMP